MTPRASGDQRGADRDAPFDLLHAFHARKAAPCALEHARRVAEAGFGAVPTVVTLTGTDVSADLDDATNGPIVRASLDAAAGVIALRASQLVELEGKGVPLPALHAVIPHGIELGSEPHDLRGALGLAADAFVVLLPGGLRPVKAQHLTFDALAARPRGALPWEVVLLGPEVDAEYAASLRARGAGEPRVHFAGAVPPERMGACYASASVVWNTSVTEGVSNAILEAQLAARPVIARRNDGNASLIEHGRDGWLFDSVEELVALTELARADPESAARVARAGRDRVTASADPRAEARRHLELYRAVLRR